MSVPRRGRAVPALARACIAAAMLLLALPVVAEFHRWRAADGQVRISNLPPAAIDARGHVRPGQHPLSLIVQQARLRERLARDAAAAAQRAAEDDSK